jgi:hypothetical protein
VKHLTLECVHDDEMLNAFYADNYEGMEKRAAIFRSFRSAISGVCENLIMLDRLLFVREQGVQAEMYEIFNKLESPRNYVLYATKD